MKSSLQTPKPLRKSRSREKRTPGISSVPSHFKTSDLSVNDVPPRHQKIRPKSLDTDFLAASEHILSDPADPVMISGESGSNLFIFTESPDLSLSDIKLEQLVSSSECLAGLEHNSSVLPNLAVSSASSCISQHSALKQTTLGQNVHSENLNKGKYEEVISASDLIKNALSEINGSKDITDGTKKIIDAMFEAAVQQLGGVETGVRIVRLAESGESGSNFCMLSNRSNLSLSDITVEKKLLSNSEYLVGSEHILSDVSHLAISPASSHTSECSAQKQLLLEPQTPPKILNKGKYEGVTSSSDLIRKALSDINQSKDIADETKELMDAILEAAVQQLEGLEIGARTVRPAGSILMANLCIALLLLVIFVFAVRLFLKFWSVECQDWPRGLTPT